jgi:hypothetical protein
MRRDVRLTGLLPCSVHLCVEQMSNLLKDVWLMQMQPSKLRNLRFTLNFPYLDGKFDCAVLLPANSNAKNFMRWNGEM